MDTDQLKLITELLSGLGDDATTAFYIYVACQILSKIIECVGILIFVVLLGRIAMRIISHVTAGGKLIRAAGLDPWVPDRPEGRFDAAIRYLEEFEPNLKDSA